MTGSTGANTQKQQLDDEIDALLKDSAAVVMSIGPDDIAQGPSAGTLPAFLQINPIDASLEEKRARKSAAKAIDSLLRFYLSEDVIDQNDYIKAKARLASMQLSTLVYQLKVAESAITTLYKEIHSGNMGPRMFEVLATMQRSVIDILKLQTLHMIATEEGTKKLKADLDFGREKGTVTIEGTGSRLTRGSRELMRGIQAELSRDESFDEGESAVDDSDIADIPGDEEMDDLDS